MGLKRKNGGLISVDMTARMITDRDMSGKDIEEEIVMNRKDIDYACEEMKKSVPELFRNHLKKMIVYGSAARDDYTEDSDIDIAILTDLDRESVKKYDYSLMDIVTEIAMHSDAIVEYICLPIDEFNQKKDWYGYFQSIQNEGIVIYG
ncbi:MAG: nucleotidyltransferase domain-containing protein [Butyrivibrio sp.]|nr:nucleotidyltransferase domain-containing protein [Butyrivibrio sp.]MBR1642143.1 nucleotidyltransferase domain-containing protein [Butyrivibrio sp.]